MVGIVVVTRAAVLIARRASTWTVGRAGRLEAGERCLGRVPNDDDFGAVTAVCDPYLTQMEIGESR
jgi:hypothetical protein